MATAGQPHSTGRPLRQRLGHGVRSTAAPHRLNDGWPRAIRPVTSLRGQDDQLVTASQAAEWAKATSREFTLTELPDGHMYLTQRAGDILRVAHDAAIHRPKAQGQTAPAR